MPTELPKYPVPVENMLPLDASTVNCVEFTLKEPVELNAPCTPNVPAEYALPVEPSTVKRLVLTLKVPVELRAPRIPVAPSTYNVLFKVAAPPTYSVL